MKQVSQWLLIGVIIAIGTYLAGHLIDCRNLKSLNSSVSTKEGEDGFAMYKNMEGRIMISTSKRGSELPSRINFLDLDTDSPSVIFQGGYGAKMPFKKVYEDHSALVIEQQPGSSLDVITINKKNGVFVRMASGIMGGTYVVAEKGQLD